MTVSQNDDRRKHSRVDFTTEIEIILDLEGKRVNLEGNSRDLSLKGIFIHTDQRFPTGTKCAVKVYLSGSIDQIELTMNGTIVRHTDSGAGIVFDSMDVETYSHLKNIVQYNSIEDSAG